LNREISQKEWYQRYYGKTGQHRNDLRLNPEVLFQTLAYEASFLRALRDIRHDPKEVRILDVGCGGGGDIYQLLRVGYDPVKIIGVDIQEDRLAGAQRLYPQSQFIHADATRMSFDNSSFDLVFESTMFATLPNDRERVAIAAEMIRVCKVGGYLLLVDWRTPKPGDPNYKALTRKELRTLFSVGSATRLLGIYKGALVPPLGRFLSKHASSLYFLVATLFPFLVGQVAYVLMKDQTGRHEQAVL
jgi:ubiquinone/menaquinone biosynthesis C-methylase UbiE